MKRILITLFSMCLCLTALGINITNYPGTNAFDSSMWFLLSKPAARTNFNLPGDYVASTSDLNSASNSILGQMPTSFGTLRMTMTNALALPVDVTYYNVTNWNNNLTNGFTSNLATGYLTNTLAGIYRITATLSFIGAASELYEVCVLTNGVDSEMVSSKKQFSVGSPRYDAVPVSGRMYLPAGTGVSLAVKNTTDNTDLTIHRASLDIGP